jgi:hypothetical protein
MSQDDQILAHMQDGNTVTPKEAYELAGTLALHSAIHRLRNRGYAIDKQMHHENGKHFGEYWLAIAH